MSAYILPLIYILSVSGALGLALKKKFKDVLPLTFMGTAILLFILGFGGLGIGYAACILAMIISILFLLVNVVRNKKLRFIMEQYDYECLIFIIIYATVIFWNFSRRIVYGGDEYSHWAFMVKEMFRLDTFYVMPESNLVAHRDYPPLIPLLQTLWCKAAGEYKEQYCYMALQLLSFSMFFPFLPRMDKKWNRAKKTVFISLQAIILLVMCAVIQVAEAGFYKTLYTDCFVGILFVYGVMLVIFSEKIDYYFWGNISVLFVFLILSKQINLFIIIVVSCLVVYKCFEHRDYLQGVWRSKFSAVIVLCICYLPSIVLNFLWSNLVDKYDTYRQFEIDKAGSIKDIVLAFIGRGTATQRSVLLDYLVNVLSEPIWERGADFSYVQCLLLLFGGMVIMFYYSNKRKNVLVLGVTTLWSGVFYAVVMLATYLFLFSDGEAVKLACFDRYLLTFIYGGALILVLCFINYADKISMLVRMAMVLVVMLLLIQPTNISKWLLPGFLYDGYSEKYEDDIAILQEYVEDGEKVYLISQGDLAGEARNILMYEVSPIKFQTYNFSLGEPKFEGDYRTVMLSVPELLTEMEGYDYLYICRSDEDIAEYYGELFIEPNGIKDEQLYRINRASDNLQLELVNK